MNTKEIKNQIDRLNSKDRLEILSYLERMRRNNKELEKEFDDIWEYMIDAVMRYDRNINIDTNSRWKPVVIFRQLIYYHVYNDWCPGISYPMMSKVSKQDHVTIRYACNKAEMMLKGTKDMWPDVFRLDNVVKTMYNNYINQ